jgi:hypothetical protein
MDRQTAWKIMMFAVFLGVVVMVLSFASVFIAEWVGTLANPTIGVLAYLVLLFTTGEIGSFIFAHGSIVWMPKPSSVLIILLGGILIAYESATHGNDIEFGIVTFAGMTIMLIGVASFFFPDK